MELMKFYRFNDLEDAKKFYGRYTSECGTGLRVSYCGKNYGENGKPNVVFHIPDWTTPYCNNGVRCNFLTGLPIPGLAEDFCESFSKTALVFLGSDCKADKHVSTHRHLHLTMDPNSVRYVMIAQQQSLKAHYALPDILSKVAIHCSIGAPGPVGENPDQCSWDYFIFPISFKYDEALTKNQAQNMLHRGDRLIASRRKTIADYLDATLGTRPEGVPWTTGGTITQTVTAPVKTTQRNPVKSKVHYEDNMRHVQTWVIDGKGRMLTPKATPNEASSFISATVACKETWDIVPEDCLVVEFVRECFSKMEKYLIVRQPKRITQAQYDRLILLEKWLETQRQKLIIEQQMTNYVRFEVGSDTAVWTATILENRQETEG